MKQKTVTLETAKWLRKRRFNEPVQAHYNTKGKLSEDAPEGVPVSWNSPAHDASPRLKVYSAPDLALAQQWVREKKHFDVLVDREYFCGKVGKYYAKIIRLRDGVMSETGKYRSYERALEAGILKALRAM
ncbi:MAG: hypothetical protein J5637_08750 [Prevotella sp.]|nr:hypothetical protein [Prevotella sp.]